MDTNKILQDLQLKEEHGWAFIDFANWSNKSFYTFMIENGEFCLDWIAFVNRLNEKKMKKHHFYRSENTASVIPNSVPKLLIVTNGTRWFISKYNSQEFKEVRFDAVMMSMYDEMKKHMDSPYVKLSGINTEYSIKATMNELRKSIRRKGESKTEKKPIVSDLFSGSGEFVFEGSYKAMYEAGKAREDIMDKLLKIKTMELNTMSSVLHNQLLKKYSKDILQLLIDIAEVKKGHVYVNMSENPGRLVFKIFDHYVFSSEFDKNELYGEYYLITEEGELTHIEINKNNRDSILFPGLFKVNIEVLKNMINNINNGK